MQATNFDAQVGQTHPHTYVYLCVHIRTSPTNQPTNQQTNNQTNKQTRQPINQPTTHQPTNQQNPCRLFFSATRSGSWTPPPLGGAPPRRAHGPGTPPWSASPGARRAPRPQPWAAAPRKGSRVGSSQKPIRLPQSSSQNFWATPGTQGVTVAPIHRYEEIYRAVLKALLVVFGFTLATSKRST